MGALMYREARPRARHDIAPASTPRWAMVSHITGRIHDQRQRAAAVLGNAATARPGRLMPLPSDGIRYLTAGTDEHYRRLTVVRGSLEIHETRFDANLKRGRPTGRELM